MLEETERLDTEICKLIKNKFTYDEIVEKLMINKRRIYLSQTRYNKMMNLTSFIKKELKQDKKDEIIKNFNITEDELKIIRKNIRMKRTELAKKLDMAKVKLNMILMILKNKE